MSLALAAVIACGIDGMKKGLKLPPPTPGDPASLSEATREQQQIKVLPRSFKERKQHLTSQGATEVGKPIRELFGAKAIENYLAVLEKDH